MDEGLLEGGLLIEKMLSVLDECTRTHMLFWISEGDGRFSCQREGLSLVLDRDQDGEAILVANPEGLTEPSCYGGPMVEALYREVEDVRQSLN